MARARAARLARVRELQDEYQRELRIAMESAGVEPQHGEKVYDISTYRPTVVQENGEEWFNEQQEAIKEEDEYEYESYDSPSGSESEGY